MVNSLPFNIEKIVLGTAQLGLNYGAFNSESLMTDDQAFEFLTQAWEMGIRWLDAAQSYGLAHGRIGKFHRETGHRFNLISKFDITNEVHELVESVEQSLETLQVSQLHGLLIHNQEGLSIIKNFPTQFFQDELPKLTKQWGASIYEPKDLEVELVNRGGTLWQIPFNLVHNQNFWETSFDQYPHCHWMGRSIFIQGLFWQQLQDWPQHFKAEESFAHLVQKYPGYGLAEISLAYVLKNPMLDWVVLGFASLDQLLFLNEFLASDLLKIDFSKELDDFQVPHRANYDPRSWS